MSITDKNDKVLYMTIEISKILKQHKCTYKEAKKILSNLQFDLKIQQECKEYDTVDDWAKGIKNQNYENRIVEGWDHFEKEVEF